MHLRAACSLLALIALGCRSNEPEPAPAPPPTPPEVADAASASTLPPEADAASASAPADATAAEAAKPAQATLVAAGGYGTCASHDGQLFCWGDQEAYVPQAVPFEGAIDQLDVGTSVYDPFACLRSDGAIYCWGSDNPASPRLGGERPEHLTPTQVDGLMGVTHLTLGNEHACALLEDGSVRCWGSRFYGQLGDGRVDTVERSREALQVLEDVSALDAYANTTCAVRKGDVLCWGQNENGQAGQPVEGAPSVSSPTPVEGLSDAVEVALGERRACARLSSGEVRCWGEGYDGLGAGPTPEGERRTYPTPRPEPVSVAGLGGPATSLLSGGTATCARVQGAGWRCWGRDASGRFGVESTDPGVPVSARNLPAEISSASMSADHLCVVRDDAIACSGRNAEGQLGDGAGSTRGDTAKPRDVPLERTARHISASNNLSCALFDDGAISCWGQGIPGVEGPVHEPRGLPLRGALMDLGASHMCAVDGEEGLVSCLGDNRLGQLGVGDLEEHEAPSPARNLDGVEALWAGIHGTCARRRDGQLWCWGLTCAPDTRLGQRCREKVSAPVRLPDFDGARGVAHVGFGDVCVATDEGDVMCRGLNRRGQHGDGTTEPHLTWTAVPGLTDVVELRGVDAMLCARTSDGAVWCWGEEGEGRIPGATPPSGFPAVPGAPSGPPRSGQRGLRKKVDPRRLKARKVLESGATQLAVGVDHACALMEGGVVRCWGYGRFGQIGNPDHDEPCPYVSEVSSDYCKRYAYGPTPVPGLDSVRAITAGRYHSCALSESGEVRCWGQSNDGQLGPGMSFTRDTLVTPAWPE